VFTEREKKKIIIVRLRIEAKKKFACNWFIKMTMTLAKCQRRYNSPATCGGI